MSRNDLGMLSPSQCSSPKRFLLSACAVALCAALFAPVAQAVQPPAPALSGTDPASPNVSTTPRIFGSADGVITSVVTSAVGGGPVAQAINPTFTITIYTDPSCTGPVAATGTSAQLEGAGIQVTVAPDSTTTFYATQTDPADPGTPSLCSTPGLTYTQATPPNPPVVTAVTPTGPADDNNPHVIGSTDPGTTVSIYANSACSGAPVGSGTDSDFAGAGIQVSVPDNSTTTFYATAFNKGVPSPCSTTSVTYQEVTPPGAGGGGAPPAPPTLRVSPGRRANDNTPVVTATAPGAVTVQIFDNPDCAGPPLVDGTAGQFASGLEATVPDDSVTGFFGLAVDGDGNASACSSAPVVYTEDSTAPQTRITLGPGFKTRKRAAVFRFTDATDETGTAFLCKLDRGKWKSCQAPWRVGRLRRKAHVARVKGIDAAGNQETVGAKLRFKVIR